MFILDAYVPTTKPVSGGDTVSTTKVGPLPETTSESSSSLSALGLARDFISNVGDTFSNLGSRINEMVTQNELYRQAQALIDRKMEEDKMVAKKQEEDKEEQELIARKKKHDEEIRLANLERARRQRPEITDEGRTETLYS